jgi:hypothetical protein
MIRAGENRRAQAPAVPHRAIIQIRHNQRKTFVFIAFRKPLTAQRTASYQRHNSEITAA